MGRLLQMLAICIFSCMNLISFIRGAGLLEDNKTNSICSRYLLSFFGTDGSPNITSHNISCEADLTISSAVEPSTKYAVSSTQLMPILSSMELDVAVDLLEDKEIIDTSNSTVESMFKNNTFKPFNEWKQQKLDGVPSNSPNRLQRVRSIINDNKEENEIMGDEMEIDLGVFATKDDSDLKEVKVYKNKFNYASLDCAATIMETNSDAKGANSILVENKDTYLLNPCSTPNKYIIIELCQDILVEEIALANFEFFSSTFKDVRFSVSDRYPTKSKEEWKMIGNFKAENSRVIQSFSIENPKIWARYLKIETLSFYDNEYYCPISIVRVHGKTMMEEFKMSNSQIGVDKSQEKIDVVDETDIEFVCDPLNNVNVSNLTDVIAMNHKLPFTQSKLLPLTFKDFLKEVNKTYCPPRTFNNSLSPAAASTAFSSSSSTEDSIFKNIMKRLTSLESNTNLTFSYIEEQSRLLSESFKTSEKNHVKKLSYMIDAFNVTIRRNMDTLSDFALQVKEQSLRILEEQKLNNDFFSTQNTRKIERMEAELAYQRRVIYFILFILSALVLSTILNREFYINDDNQGNNWLISEAKINEGLSYSDVNNISSGLSDVGDVKKNTYNVSSYSSESFDSDGDFQPPFGDIDNSIDKVDSMLDDINVVSSQLEFTHTNDTQLSDHPESASSDQEWEY